MSLLSKIRKREHRLPPRFLVYGIRGIGLSTFAAEAASPIFLSAENDVTCDSFPICKSFEEIISCLESLKNEKHDYQTLVINTLDWVEKLLLAEARKLQETDAFVKADGGFGQNNDLALLSWRQMTSMLYSLREEKDMTIILLAREKSENQSDTRPFPPLELHRSATVLWCEWCDAVLHATFGPVTPNPEDRSRILLRDTTTKCNIKNRYNIPDALPFRWSSLAEHFAPGDNPSH